jgi:hypothetical protein
VFTIERPMTASPGRVSRVQVDAHDTRPKLTVSDGLK